MEKFTYTPDDDVKIHPEGAIRLICGHFQSHEAGLPEWLKNSADAYAREKDAPMAKRTIFVIFDHDHKDRKPSISVLDFSGMTSSVIEDSFRNWADPEAAKGEDPTIAVQGGHGNGGKCYMTQMFDDYAFIHTVKNDKGNLYGITGGAIIFGYVPNPEKGRNFHVDNKIVELNKVLNNVGCSLPEIQKVASEAIRMADGFTLITGLGPKGYGNRIPTHHLINNLQDHPQMIQTLQLCNVHIVINGKLYNRGKKLTLTAIKPMEGEEDPRVIMIPEILVDPDSVEDVSTIGGESNPQGALILKTSQGNMRYKKRRGRHNIVYKAVSGYIGYTLISEFDVRSSYSAHIYGECELMSLEPFKQNDRSDLSKSPLTRAVKQFISEEIQKFAEEFEARDRKQYDKEEKNAISKMNEALDNWKNRFLGEMFRGMWGSGDSGGPKPREALPSGKPDRIELALTHQKAGLGISLRPRLKFFDKDGRRIRGVPYTWISDDNNVAMVDEDLMILNTFSYGKTLIHAETLNKNLRSNAVPLEVVRILDIVIVPTEVEIVAGSRQRLEAVCNLENGEEVKNVFLEWIVDDRKVAMVSTAGTVFGFIPGETSVIAGDDKCESINPAIVKVVVGDGIGGGDKRGKGYPTVLVSGEINRDPDTYEYRHFSREEPPVLQHPEDVDRNLWWINSNSPLARLYLDINKGYGYHTQAWRMYHLERYIDVIVQIALISDPDENEKLSVDEWNMKWGEQASKIQAAATVDLSEFIAEGELPE